MNRLQGKVALITGSMLLGDSGSSPTACSVASAAATAPARTRSWAVATARRTTGAPRRVAAARSRASASIASVRGTVRRGS